MHISRETIEEKKFLSIYMSVMMVLMYYMGWISGLFLYIKFRGISGLNQLHNNNLYIIDNVLSAF